MAATSFFGGAFFGGEFFNTPAAVAATEILGAGNWGKLLDGGKKKSKRKKPLRWSEYADAEERRQALAQALAEAAVPLSAIRTPDWGLEIDAIIEEEDALITALILSRIIH